MSAPSAPLGASTPRLQVVHEGARQGVELPSMGRQLLLEALPVELEVSPDDLGVVGTQDGADLRPRHPVATKRAYRSDPLGGRAHRLSRRWSDPTRT